MTHPDDPEDVDPGLARERTRLAWLRTAMAFGVLGGAVLKTSLAAGVTVLALVPFVWLTGRLSRRPPAGTGRPGRLLLIAVAITVAALVVLAIVLSGHGSSPGLVFPLHFRSG